ncbi:L-threonylcarbamoyladenylate synthase [Flavihumibacter stibioxidans]|uniref:Threonylcarbamoyl-AMP synthase n=1 Tax=Flavihumibacter stibioxidans TaxID=1834163 RepID=A0ABR7MCE1_9BACT|nr:L-threonylcarbamoyladenylate synthase [Flavihumibacter stibioxidans]MBC6492291.1 threonylcarbamoyl-AMP synthase [Flavihumibacter stibioxidans]
MSAQIGKDIGLAAEKLRAGELVAIPTETVYGLAANALNEMAVVKIYQVKNRPQFNPLILHVANMEQLRKLGLELPEAARELAARFSPGPLTYVIPTSPKIPDIVTAGTQAVAVRIPNHPMTLELLQQLEFPLAAPSANPSGYVSPTSALHVAGQLGDQVGYILDGGDCKVGLESTIISFLEEKPRLLRYGGIPLESIEAVIGPVELPQEGYSDNPVAPGMLARHYATRHPLQLGKASELVETALKTIAASRIVTITLETEIPGIPATHQFVLSPEGNLEEAARRLFGALRLADEMEIDLIIADMFPEKGLGRAINDRLRRASIR